MKTDIRCCPAEAHDLLRASPVAFRACVDLTFRSWGVDEAGRDIELQYGNCRRPSCRSTLSIPLALLSAAVNPHERAARARKVGKLLAIVPMGATRQQMDDLADMLVRFDESARARWAAAVGCSRPSLATWAELVAAARCRLTTDEIFARAMGPETAARS